MTVGRFLAQASAYGVFIVVVGGLSNTPVYQRLAPDEALVRLAFSHFGRPVQECRRLSQTELNALAPNMRKAKDCPRQRRPIQVEFELDEQVLLRVSLPATGIWGDGEATVYERFTVPAGPHRLNIRMRDSDRGEGFDYQLDKRVTIKPLQNLVIGFDPGLNKFIIN